MPGPDAGQMRCHDCQQESPAEARFCIHCGRPLATAEQAPPPVTYTPEHLARKILTSGSAMQGERKQVTVLFVDLVDSLQLAERLGAEAWHRLMERCFEILSGAIHRCEGTVNQYTGDGVMALFGAPIAHEDHARRACEAALEARRGLAELAAKVRRHQRLDLGVRMGLNSGEVVVGKIGDDLRMDYTAQGQTVGLAARMERLAEPGGICLGEATARQVDGYFELEPLGSVAVKGVGKPVRVWTLTDAGPLSSRLDVSRRRGLSHFVGRRAVMTTLESCLEHAEQGSGQVVGLVGAAGVGKSRVCFELARRCRERGIRVVEPQPTAHSRNLPLSTLVALLRALLDLPASAADQEVRERVAAAFELLDKTAQAARPLVLELLHAFDPEHPPPAMLEDERQRHLLAVTAPLLRACTAGGPAVLLLDDLHALDPQSEPHVAQLAEAVAGERLLLLVNFRPGYRADWMTRSSYQQFALGELDGEASQHLFETLLGEDPSVAGLGEAIFRRTGGNPFFIEELVRSLVEARQLIGEKGAYRWQGPAPELDVPASIQALLAARIDRLAERDKEVLQTAAVIGPRFATPILEHLTELEPDALAAALGVLRGAELVRRCALGEGDADHVFEHPLTEEVAYRSLLVDRRNRLHSAVALALEARGERLGEQAALIAHHWRAAGRRYEAARWQGFASLRVTHIQVRRRRPAAES